MSSNLLSIYVDTLNFLNIVRYQYFTSIQPLLMKFLIFLILILINFSFSEKDVFESMTSHGDSLCDDHLNYIEDNFAKGAVWAKKIKDSWGSFPSGIYSGNYYDFGSFDQCIEFSHFSESYGVIYGQYCTIVFEYYLEVVDKRGRFAPSPYNPNVNIGVGICVPHTCSASKINEIANSTLAFSRNLTISQFFTPELMCTTELRGFDANALQIFTMYFLNKFCSFLIILFILVEFSQ